MEWKLIPSSQGRYEASEDGQIRNVKTKRILSQHTNNKGYKTVYKMASSTLVSRLVAEAWIPNPENKPEVDHIDSDTSNNAASNLRWVTRSENLRNEHRSKLIKEWHQSEAGKQMHENAKGRKYTHSEEFLQKQANKMEQYKTDYYNGMEMKDLRKKYGTQFVASNTLPFLAVRGLNRLMNAIKDSNND